MLTKNKLKKIKITHSSWFATSGELNITLDLNLLSKDHPSLVGFNCIAR